MKLNVLTASKHKIVSLQYRDKMGNAQKAHGRLMLVTNRIVIVKNMRTKQFRVVLVDSIGVIKAQKQTHEYASILPVIYTPIADGFSAIMMNIKAPAFIPSFA